MTRMVVRLLTSKQNPLLKTIRLVATQARRAPDGLVLAEGVRVLEEVVRSGRPAETAVVSEAFGRCSREQRLLAHWEESGTPVYRASEAVYRSVSDVMSPQGALALVRVPSLQLRSIDLPSAPLIVCGCEVQDPGNLGSLIRTSAAAGCAFFCTTAGTVSARNPKVIRSSAGTFFRIPVLEHLAAPALISYAHDKRIQLFRTSALEGIDYAQADFRPACGIVLGNEAQGISAAEWSALPALRIPISGGVESLNVAAAGAILVFEAVRQRAGTTRRAGSNRSMQ